MSQAQWQVQSLAPPHAFPSERSSDFRVAHSEPQKAAPRIPCTCKTLHPVCYLAESCQQVQAHQSQLKRTIHPPVIQYTITVESDPPIFFHMHKHFQLYYIIICGLPCHDLQYLLKMVMFHGYAEPLGQLRQVLRHVQGMSKALRKQSSKCKASPHRQNPTFASGTNTD